MSNDETKALCLKLMKADREDEIVELLKEYGYWDDRNSWRLYGDDESNYSAAGNQADIAAAAIVEKITNSRDAILMNYCYLNSIEPKSDLAPISIKAAVAKFFDENPNGEYAGQIKEWSEAKRREVATKNLAIYLTGNKPSDGYPCVNIADRGEGQTPLQLPNTILSLGKKNKKEIPFVHGKWNMGGTAALLYCGERNLQFVVSKRSPYAIKMKGVDNDSDNNWGFTIVRRDDPKGINDTSVYRYLAPINKDLNPEKGSILNFSSAGFPIFPDFENPYAMESEWGTLIKLYEYQIKHKQMIGGRGDSLLRPLDLLAPDLGLPFRLHECRYGGPGGSRVHQVNGLTTRLFVDKGDVLEEGFPTYHNPDIDGEKISIGIYAFKQDKARVYRETSKAIIFSLNGQSQGWLSDYYFAKPKVGLGFIKNSLLVIVDCSELSDRAQEKLFVNDRVHIRQEGPFWERIESEIIDYLANHKKLFELQEERKRKLSAEKLDDSKPLESVLASVFKHSTTLSRIFLTGDKLSNAFKSEQVQEQKKKFVGNQYPTFFKFKKIKYGETLERDAFIGVRSRISFETDAENSYFNRKSNRGIYKLLLLNQNDEINEIPKGDLPYGLNLLNGIATLTVDLGSRYKVGDTISLILEVTDPMRIVEPAFSNKIILNVKEEPEKGNNGGGGGRRNPPNEKKGSDRERPGGIKFPKIFKVYEKDWISHPGFNKYSAMQVAMSKVTDNGLETFDFTFYVNMDNIYLKHEIKENIEEVKTLEACFEFGMALVGISLIYDNKENQVEDKQYENIEDQISQVSRALAPILIPMVKGLGGAIDLKSELIDNLVE